MSFEHPGWLAETPVHGEDADVGTDDEPDPRRWYGLVFISMAIMLIGVDVSITGIAAPALSAQLQATNTDIQWVFDGFTLALAGFVLLGGGVADRFGRKGTFQAGMGVFAAGSLVAAFAPNPPVLVLGRIITGLGAALVMPPALSMLTVTFPPRERTTAISIWSSIAALGIALGPVIGGYLLADFWFGSVFLINVPVTVVAVIGVAVFVRTSRRPGPVELDVVGAVLSVVALTGVVGGIIEAPVRGWTSSVVVAALVVGGIGTAAFIRWELRQASPLLDLRVFSIPRVVAGALALVIVYLTFNGTEALLIPQYLQYVEGYSTLAAGWLLLPVGVVFGVTTALTPRASRRVGERTIIVVGVAMMVVGLLVYALLGVWGGYANVLLATFVLFAGIGLVVAPSTSVVMGAVPTSKAGDASAVNQVSRQMGGALGAAISGSVFAVAYGAQLATTAPDLTADQLATADRSVGAALGLASDLSSAAGDAIDTAARQAATTAMVAAFLVAAALTAAVLVATVVLLRSRPAASAD